MDNTEQIRLNEIIFCNLFKKLLKEYSNPIRVYDLIEAMAKLVDANVLVLNSVLNIILSNDEQYLPTKREYMILLKKANIPVRKACKLANMSQSTYYSMSEAEYYIQPKFSQAQYEEMLKILAAFDNIHENMEGSIL